MIIVVCQAKIVYVHALKEPTSHGPFTTEQLQMTHMYCTSTEYCKCAWCKCLEVESSVVMKISSSKHSYYSFYFSTEANVQVIVTSNKKSSTLQ